MISRRYVAAALAVVSLVASAAPVRAAYPEKPIRLIVPFSPGGGTDTIARTLGTLLAQSLGQPVLVDNKPGASTMIGSEFVAKAAPDGYTLLVATLAHAVNPSMQRNVPFDTEKAFAPVSLIGSSYNVLVVRADSKLTSVADVIAAAKANPGKLSYASQGSGTSAHLAGELFDNLAHVEMLHIPYRGAGPALIDVLGGRVDIMFATNAAVAPFITDHRLRALGTTAPDGRSPLPGVPSIEQTVPGYSVDSWYAVYAPAGTPPAIIDKLAAAIADAAKTPEMIKRASQEGVTLRPGGPAELRDFMAGEFVRWRKLVTENKISAD